MTALELKFPSVVAPEGTPSEMMTSSCAKQVAYIFDADEKEIDDIIKSDESKEIEVRLCGREQKARVVCNFISDYLTLDKVESYFGVSF